MAAYTYAYVDNDVARVSVAQPQAGTWTAIISTYQGASGYTEPVNYDISTSAFVTTDSVTPKSFTLAPGASQTLNVSLGAPAAARDYSRDLELDSSTGRHSVVPIVLRSLVPVASGGAFAGEVAGPSGTETDTTPEQETFAFDVPPGAPALTAAMTLSADPGTKLDGVLVSPDGQSLAQGAGQTTSSSGDRSLQLVHLNPAPGRWRLVLWIPRAVGGTTTAAEFTGHVTLNPYPVSAVGVPNNPALRLLAGRPVTAQITLSNPGPDALTQRSSIRACSPQRSTGSCPTRRRPVCRCRSPERIPASRSPTRPVRCSRAPMAARRSRSTGASSIPIWAPSASATPPRRGSPLPR